MLFFQSLEQACDLAEKTKELADQEMKNVTLDCNGTSLKGGNREGRNGSKGGRGSFKERTDSDDQRQKDPCGVFLFFPNVITADIAAELLRVGKCATEMRLGKMCYMNFATEGEAAQKKKELAEIYFEGVKLHVDSAYKQRDSSKQNSSEDTEAAASENKEERIPRAKRGRGLVKSVQREKDPCGIFLFFKSIIKASLAAKLLLVGKSASQIRFGRMCHMNFSTEDEAEKMKRQLAEMDFDGLKPHIDSAYKHRYRDSNRQRKRTLERDAEVSPVKKMKMNEEKGDDDEDESIKETMEEEKEVINGDDNE
ncbi:uncharacterized protein [Panulirus ornatus]|uniref:uncharacterized protein isoform X2 n=1 Tax=Panulirus ornatus TaxID=150431 RepID=UPI003A8591ED